MNKDVPFTTHGDEALEARIVAWVLGEASAFEAAELERLCEERPELMVFKRRIAALHGMLHEAENSKPDESWRLPPEKRNAVEAILGEEKPIRLEVAKEKRIRHSGRRALLAIAACLAMAFVVMRLQPWKATSEAVIEVRPATPAISPMAEASGSERPAAQFFGTEFEKIKSRESLGKVVDRLDLAKRWNMDKEQAVEELKDSIRTKNVDGTDLVKIQVRKSDKQEADEIAREVAFAYKDYREGLEREQAEKQLAELNKAVRDQEDKVEERRKVLATIARTKGIINRGGNLSADESREEAIKRGLDAKDLVDARREFETDQELLQQMKLKQMAETISRRAPSDSVVIHELPGQAGATGKSGSGALALNETARSQRLRTELPAELIEGTPRAMNVPNLEVPKDGPAGSETWSLSRAAVEGGTRVEAKPSAPTSSSTKAIVANTVSPNAIAVPDIEVSDSSLAFGDTDFGAGSGGGVAQNYYAQPATGGFAGQAFMGGRAATDESTDSAGAPSDGNGLLADQKSRQGGDAGITVGREFSYPTEFEPPAPPSAPAPAAFPVTPATPAEFAANTRAEEQTAQPRPAGRVITEEVRYKIDESDKRPAHDASDADDTSKAVAHGKKTGTDAAPGAETVSGLRSGDAVVSRDNIDAIVNSTTTDAAPGTETNGRVPTLSDLPATGRLFQNSERSDSAVRIPQITTREITPRENLDAAVAARKSGRYEEARALLSGGLAADPGNQELRQELQKLDDPIRTNPALSYEHKQNVDAVQSGLHKAEGNFNLGKFDDAKRGYEDVLRTDPSNQAARRGMEKIETAKSEYYRAAYDHTRSELLAQVDKAWELEVPAEGNEIDGFINYGAPIAGAGAALPDDAEALAKAIRDQEDKVEERRKVLATTVRTKGIIHRGGEGTSDESKDEAIKRGLDAQDYVDAKKEYESEEALLAHMKLKLADGLDAESLAKAIRDQEDKVEERRKVLGTIARTKGIIYKGQDEATKEETREEAIKRGLDAQDYADAKREFEQDQELLQQMKLKLMGRTIKAKQVVPKIDLSKLMEEISAAEEPYSTFSLNISDASFRIAQAALAKGEQPDPAGIKVEQFYNAVDYGDPAPASNEPVACAIEQSAHPVIPGRNLVRIALKTAAVGRSAAQPLRLTLLVDQSGSMSRADRRAAMDKALGGLAGLLTKDDVVNVIGFSRTPRLLADGMTGDQAAKLAELVNQSASEGGTNLEEAMKLADQLAIRHKQPGAQNRIVLFTDGAANLGDADPERLAEKVKDLRQKGIAFDIAGIAADDLNDALLGELARNGNGRYYVVGKDDHDNFAKQLAGAFRPAAENVKVQVRFNPERVARYKLIGFEKDRLKTEDFRNDKVDAAELAAEEAGVAIYQIEPLAEGSGEIGEVSVRFRDTASGEMVERAWTIPHDPAAPALDRATPSMQLATLAMLAAEKLKGGPLGEAVDFRQFAEAQATVKSFYSGNPRVAELLRMLEMLK